MVVEWAVGWVIQLMAVETASSDSVQDNTGQVTRILEAEGSR